MSLRTALGGMRNAATKVHFGHRSDAFEVVRRAPGPARDHLRVVSFNIQGAHAASTARIAAVLADLDADIIALQEVDRGVERSGGEDQVATIAERLQMSWAFAATLAIEGGDYGVALLTRRPLLTVARHDIVIRGASEPRVVIDARVEVASGVRVLATHADFLPWSASAHAHELLRHARASLGQGTIVLGDLNSIPGMFGPRRLMQAGLHDVIAEHDEGPTLLQPPNLRVDYILVDDALASSVASARRVLVQVSDHCPIVAELALTSGRFAVSC